MVKKILILFIVIYNTLYGQITVDPPAVFIDPVKNIGSMTITNNTNKKLEISVSFQYGYVDYDSTGKPFINFKDTKSEKDHSLAPYIKAFPPKLLLYPYGRNYIQYVIRNTSAMKNGMYWTRVYIRSREYMNVTDTGRNKSAFKVHTKIIGAVIYKKGDCSTGLKIKNFSYSPDSEDVDLHFDFERYKGNSPFFGNLNFNISDDNGNIVYKSEDSPLTVYFKCVQEFKIDKSLFVAGKKYHINISIGNERDDIPPDYKIDFDKIEEEFPLTMP